MSDIKVKVDSEKDCVQTIKVELPVARVKENIEKAFQTVRSQVKLPGFRPGKAPIEMVKENFTAKAYEAAQDYLLREGVAEALKTKKLTPVESPVIQSADFHPEKAFQFEFQVEVAPSVKLSSYKGLKLTKTAKAVGDAEVKKALDEIANVNARLTESKKETLDNACYAVIDYEGLVDGKPIPGAKADNFLLDMSAPQAIAGLAEGLVGAKVGESREVSVKFPDDSPSKELAGKTGVFRVKLNAIKEKQTPNVDDEFAKDVGFESLADLKAKVRENLESELKTAQRREMETQVIDRLIEENQFAVPQSQVGRQVEYLTLRQKDQMSRQGIPEAQQAKFFEQVNGDLRKQAEKDVKLAYLFNAIADAEKIEPTQDEINARINLILERSDPKGRAKMEKTLRGQYAERLRSEIREAKLFDWLISNAKVKETAGGSKE